MLTRTDETVCLPVFEQNVLSLYTLFQVACLYKLWLFKHLSVSALDKYNR